MAKFKTVDQHMRTITYTAEDIIGTIDEDNMSLVEFTQYIDRAIEALQAANNGLKEIIG